MSGWKGHDNNRLKDASICKVKEPLPFPMLNDFCGRRVVDNTIYNTNSNTEKNFL